MMTSVTISAKRAQARSCFVSKSFNRYWTRKFNRVRTCNGPIAAAGLASDLLSAVRRWQARGSAGVIPRCSVRRNGHYKRLFLASKARPEVVYNLLKVLGQLGDVQPPRGVSYVTLRKVLEEKGPSPDLPRALEEWYLLLEASRSDRWRYWSHFRSPRAFTEAFKLSDTVCSGVFSYACTRVGHSEWQKYWARHRYRLFSRIPPEQWSPQIWPELYKDHIVTRSGTVLSTTQDEDIDGLVPWLVSLEFSNDKDLYNWVSGEVPGDILAVSRSWPYGPGVGYRKTPGRAARGFARPPVPQRPVCGRIHLVEKDARKWRHISVPNRYLAELLVPFQARLEMVARNYHQVQCMWDQTMFDSQIQLRVDNPRKSVFSVDLSMATEHVPLDWLSPLLAMRSFVLSRNEDNARKLFFRVARGDWDAPNFPLHRDPSGGLDPSRAGDAPLPGLTTALSWTVGQPLGTKPSFLVLSLTQILVCEALSLENGHLHSPYRILGDDLVLFSRKLSTSYRRMARLADIPIALEKSYSGALAEFAGRTFIRFREPFHTPRPGTLTMSSLFDWQRASGVRIRWSVLPRSLRAQFGRIHQQVVKTLPAVLLDCVTDMRSHNLYDLMAELLAPKRGAGMAGPSRECVFADMRQSFGVLSLLSQELREDLMEVVPRMATRPYRKTFLDLGSPRAQASLSGFYHQTCSLSSRRRTDEWWAQKFRPMPVRQAIEVTLRAHAVKSVGMQLAASQLGWVR